jgi:hypothetical protein
MFSSRELREKYGALKYKYREPYPSPYLRNTMSHVIDSF